VQTKQFRVQGQREEPDLILNELTRRLFAAMGPHASLLGTFAPLFINGQLKGMFNLAERFSEEFLSQVRPPPVSLPTL
jgi:hypothetical protein